MVTLRLIMLTLIAVVMFLILVLMFWVRVLLISLGSLGRRMLIVMRIAVRRLRLRLLRAIRLFGLGLMGVLLLKVPCWGLVGRLFGICGVSGLSVRLLLVKCGSLILRHCL